MRYDSERLTAPTFLFVTRHYLWSEFEDIAEEDNLMFKLHFAGNKMTLQKYLVGMPVFLTFVSDLKALNRKT
ncbi:MAG: hypothetical protein AAF307_02080 [Pseudomonadota bacterium]